VRGPQLEDHLLLGAEIELLQMPPAAQVPHVQAAAVLSAEQKLGIDSLLHHVGRAPRARDHRVEAKVPPHVVRQLLRSAVELPSTEHVERLRVENEGAARTIAVRRAERAEIDSLRPAMHRMRRGVPGASGERLGFDRLHDPRLPRVGFRVHDVNARRMDARHHQIAPLHVRMRRPRAEAGTAGVPPEVVQLVSGVRHVGLTDEAAVRFRVWIEVHHAHRVGASLARRIDERHVRESLGRRLRGHRG
jgi:hypothetical protein